MVALMGLISRFRFLKFILPILIVIVVGYFVMSFLGTDRTAGNDLIVPTLPPTLEPGDPNASATPVIVTTVVTNNQAAISSNTPNAVVLPPWTAYTQGQAYAKNDGVELVVVDRRHMLSPDRGVCQDNSTAGTRSVGDTGVRMVVGEQYIHESAYADFAALVAAAKAAGNDVAVRTICRSYKRQDDIYNANLAQDPYADTTTLRAGYSPHQLGTSVIFTTDEVGDFNAVTGWTNEFANTALGEWLVANAHNYGFVMPYGYQEECKTGVQYSSWEWRWIGRGNAATWYNAKQADPALTFVEWLYSVNEVPFQPYCS